MLDNKNYTGNKTDVPDFLKVLLTLKKNIMRDLNVAEVCKVTEVNNNVYTVVSINNSNLRLKCTKLSSLNPKKDDLVLVIFTNTDYRLNLGKTNKPFQNLPEETLHSLNYGIITGLVGEVDSERNGTRVTVNGIFQPTWNADAKANQSSLDATNRLVETKANQSDLNTTNNNVATNTSNIATNTSDINNLKTSKANNDLSNVTYPQMIPDGIEHQGAGDRVIETYISSDGKTWYRKWASGWKECGGYSTVALYLFKKTIVLPNITFANTYYTIMITPENRGTGDDNYSWWLEESITTSQFTVRLRVNTPTIRYYCCGY